MIISIIATNKAVRVDWRVCEGPVVAMSYSFFIISKVSKY